MKVFIGKLKAFVCRWTNKQWGKHKIQHHRDGHGFSIHPNAPKF